MLAQSRRRWTNIYPTMAQCLIAAGYHADTMFDSTRLAQARANDADVGPALEHVSWSIYPLDHWCAS